MINKTTHKKHVLDYGIDEKKFWRNVNILSEDECWEWQRACNTTGYGLFSVRSTDEEYERTGRTWSQVLAHRVALALNDPLERHDYILHKCDNRKCCNPSHLRTGTSLENHQDMVSKGRRKGCSKVLVD